MPKAEKCYRQIKPSVLIALLLGLTILFVTHASADNTLRNRVISGLSIDGGWDRDNAELIAERLETSFALHDSVGNLESRIKNVRLLAGNLPAQNLAVQHPGYLDAFLSDPDGYAQAMASISGDGLRKEGALTALLRRPTAEGLKDSLVLLRLYGENLAGLSSQPGFLDFFEALSWVADDAPPALADWLKRRLDEIRPQDIGQMTELFLMHRFPLRDRHNAQLLEDAWQVLNRTRRLNPELTNLLLEHRNVWSMLLEPDFVSAMDVQVRHDQDQARDVLVFLLGRQGALYGTLDGFKNWSAPLPEANRRAALKIISDNDASTIYVMFYWRDSPEFWSFIANRERLTFVPCLLRKGAGNPANLGPWWGYKTSALANICDSDPSIFVRSIPFYAVYDVGNKMIDGVPLDWGDAANLGLESLSIVTVAKAGGILGRLSARTALATVEVGNPDASTLGKAGRRATADSTAATVRNVVADQIRLDKSRINHMEPRRGVGRALGVDGVDLVASLAKKPGAQPAMALVMEYGMNASGSIVVEHTISTEFFRCAALPTTQTEDAICNMLSSALGREASQ